MTDDLTSDFRLFEEARTRVMTMAADLCADASCPIQPVLDRCVDRALESRWSSPIKTYIPLLAFREVQECIRLGACPEFETGTP